MSFYDTPAWKLLRLNKLENDPFCETPGCRRMARQVHHRCPISIDPSRALQYSNLESKCDSCHSAAHGHSVPALFVRIPRAQLERPAANDPQCELFTAEEAPVPVTSDPSRHRA